MTVCVHNATAVNNQAVIEQYPFTLFDRFHSVEEIAELSGEILVDLFELFNFAILEKHYITKLFRDTYFLQDTVFNRVFEIHSTVRIAFNIDLLTA